MQEESQANVSSPNVAPYLLEGWVKKGVKQARGIEWVNVFAALLAMVLVAYALLLGTAMGGG